MKNDIFKFFNDIFKFIFSGWTLFFVAVVLFGWVIINIGNANSAERKQTQLRTEACYSQGMVLVQSDAGQRCVLPQSLVKVK